jgi:hypothetical protein
VRRILKYPLPERKAVSKGDGAFQFEVSMPQHPRMLHAGMSESGELCVWALVDDTRASQQRKILVIGTGREFDLHGFAHIQTVQVGAMVWHVFDGGPA